MTTEIFNVWFKKFDRKMKVRDRRFFYLFTIFLPTTKIFTLDSAKLRFIPSNTTSELRPLDQGIIDVIDGNHRKLPFFILIKEKSSQKFSSQSLYLLLATG